MGDHDGCGESLQVGGLTGDGIGSTFREATSAAREHEISEGILLCGPCTQKWKGVRANAFYKILNALLA
jgi:hypothetical protein